VVFFFYNQRKRSLKKYFLKSYNIIILNHEKAIFSDQVFTSFLF
jgi:hypothetical protein